ATGARYEISYSGTSHLQLAADVAATFVAAARSPFSGAQVFNVGGAVVDMRAVVDAIADAVPASAGPISIAGPPLPFPPEVDHARLGDAIGAVPETPLAEGVRETIAAFRSLVARGLIDPAGR